MRKRQKKKILEILALACAQILLTIIVLAGFDLFHHVLPERKQQRDGMIKPIGAVITTAPTAAPEAPTAAPEAPTAAPEAAPAMAAPETAVPERPASPAPIATPAAAPTPATIPATTASAAGETSLRAAAGPDSADPPAEPELPAAPKETDMPRPRTLRERFAEHFSEEIIVTESSYTSPNISVTIEKVERPPEFPDIVYFFADIYLADINCFQAAFPVSGTFAEARYIARDNHAILAVNGDCMVSLQQGLAVRNGMIYHQMPGVSDYCALYRDGTMETFGPDEYMEEEILAREPVHVWQFGPELLDDEGNPLDEFNISRSLLPAHPRTALGYYEPGHYCFVVVDGRSRGYSEGATMEELARLMKTLGCTAAFNLDGGASSAMVFNNSLVNQPSGVREINDMLIIREPEAETSEIS